MQIGDVGLHESAKSINIAKAGDPLKYLGVYRLVESGDATAGFLARREAIAGLIELVPGIFKCLTNRGQILVTTFQEGINGHVSEVGLV